MSGVFLTFEGIEGSGKSTQARRLEAWLRAEGHTVLLVREPGGTDLSERLRELLLAPTQPPPSPWSELCMYIAARAQLIEEKIRPALARGEVVLADRFADASVAYQGGGRRLGASRVRALNRWIAGGLSPERTFLLDIEPVRGLTRIRTGRGERFDRLESEPLAFHRRVRAAYLRLARAEPDRVRVLDAAHSVEELEATIRADVVALLERGIAPA